MRQGLMEVSLRHQRLIEELASRKHRLRKFRQAVAFQLTSLAGLSVNEELCQSAEFIVSVSDHVKLYMLSSAGHTFPDTAVLTSTYSESGPQVVLWYRAEVLKSLS